MRHVGLVALEALLVAAIVWIATMTLAGAMQADGLVGSANAGPVATLTITDARLGGSAVVTATPGDEGMWVHAACTQGASSVSNQWSRIDAAQRAVLTFESTSRWTSGGAACTAEEGYFSANGRWRVVVSRTFMVAASSRTPG